MIMSCRLTIGTPSHTQNMFRISIILSPKFLQHKPQFERQMANHKDTKERERAEREGKKKEERGSEQEGKASGKVKKRANRRGKEGQRERIENE